MPDPELAIQTVVIIGPGLIGGSFGLGLRKAGFVGSILGVGDLPYAQTALDVGAIDRISTLEDAGSDADLVYLSGTVDHILKTIDHLEGIVRPGCLVTDVGSTKRVIVDRASLRLRSALFVGGHPMAGKEKRGAENADPDLFKDRPYVLTSRPSDPIAEEFRSWLERLGARLIEMEPAQHDATVAYSSHLPQLLSTALAYTLAQRGELPVMDVFGSGLTDMTRLALSAPGLWDSILKTNADQVVSAVDDYIGTLNLLRNSLSSSKVLNAFEVANGYAYSLRNQAQSKTF